MGVGWKYSFLVWAALASIRPSSAWAGKLEKDVSGRTERETPGTGELLADESTEPLDVRHVKRAPEKSHSLAINPVKPILGLANLEYELNPIRHLGLRVALEYLVFKGLGFLPDMHPDFVAQVGARWYILSGAGAFVTGPFVGVQVGYHYTHRSQRRHDGFAGIELGYELALLERLSLVGRGLINVEWRRVNIAPGAEILLVVFLD